MYTGNLVSGLMHASRESMLDSIVAAKNALTDAADPVTGAMSTEQIQAWFDLDDLQRQLLGQS